MGTQGKGSLHDRLQPLYELLDVSGQAKSRQWDVNKLMGAGDLRAQVERLAQLDVQQPEAILTTLTAIGAVLKNLHAAAKTGKVRIVVYEAVISFVVFAREEFGAVPIPSDEVLGMAERNRKDLRLSPGPIVSEASAA